MLSLIVHTYRWFVHSKKLSLCTLFMVYLHCCSDCSTQVVEGYNPGAVPPHSGDAILAILRRKPGVTDAEILAVWEAHSERVG